MDRLADILDKKGREVLRIDAGASVLDAVERMVEQDVGSLLVTDGDEVAGIVTERDYLRRVALQGRTDREILVREIVSSPLISGGLETTVDECMALMTERRIRHLPILEDGVVVGIVSIGDVVKYQLDRRQFELRYLNEFITAR